MELIQSFWSKAMTDVWVDERDESVINMGWVAKKYFYFSWALSCLCILKYNKKLTLITDKVGYETLVRKIGLPYTDVDLALNELDNYSPRLWSLSKLYAYSIQDRPFLHFDYDLMISGELPNNLSSKSIVGLHVEKDKVYNSVQKNVEMSMLLRSPYLSGGFRSPVLINSGVLGGYDINCFKELFVHAKDFITDNLATLDHANIHPKYLNRYIEFVLFSNICHHYDLKIHFLLEGINHRKDGLGAVYNFPLTQSILHINHEYRKNDRVCEQIANLLMTEFPEYYFRILNLMACGELQ